MTMMCSWVGLMLKLLLLIMAVLRLWAMKVVNIATFIFGFCSK